MVDARRRRLVTWLAAGGGSALAAVLGTVLVLQAVSGPACAAPPTGSAAHSGKATFYDLASGGGNCSYPGPPADRLYVALSPGEYSGAAACGGYLDVTGPRGKVRVKIVDQCPECETGHIDLSREAFARIADPVQGIVRVTYRAVVNPSLPGSLAFRIKEGASRFWFAVLVIDHGNPLATVEARGSGSTWQRLSRADFNYWIGDSGLGSGPFTVRLRDVYGQQATAKGIRLAPAQVQRTSVAMYGKGAPPPAGAKAAKSARAASPQRNRSLPPSTGPLPVDPSPASSAPQSALPPALAGAAEATHC